MRGKQETPVFAESTTKPLIRNGIAIILLIAVTIAAMLALVNLVARNNAANDQIGSVVTVTGTPVCLPHKGNGEVVTLECALGLKGDDGRYYGLDGATSSLIQEDFGKRVMVKGVLSAPEANTIYAIAGSITVDSATRQ